MTEFSGALLTRAGELLISEARKYKVHIEIGEALKEAGALVAILEEEQRKAKADLSALQQEQTKVQERTNEIIEAARAEGETRGKEQAATIVQDAKNTAERLLQEAEDEMRGRRASFQTETAAYVKDRQRKLNDLDYQISTKTNAVLALEERVKRADEQLAAVRKAVGEN